MQNKFGSANWRDYVPTPVCEQYAHFNELYEKAWQLAYAHVRNIDGMPQNPYMDEAFCDTQTWIWDTCFMSLFCKYAREVFPGVQTLNNFYSVLYGGGSLPKIIPNENEPSWTHATPGVANDIYIHIADNPPLFAWSEYENALFSGDLKHLSTLLNEKKYLQQHYEWIENLTESVTLRGVFLPTRLIAEKKGYRWEGGRSGMDNTPRGRITVRDGSERPNNDNMLWIDAICQQALCARTIAKAFTLIGNDEQAAAWMQKYEQKKRIVNDNYYDDGDGFYYDIDVNTGNFYKVKTPASYWALLSGIATADRGAAMVGELFNPNTLGGDVPVISLARNDGDFYDDGRYWRGGLWLPTAYITLKGLTDYGYANEARELAIAIITHMLNTYRDFTPHTIWECYSPTKCEPALTADGKEYARPNFCGWSALGPISAYIEFVLGFNGVNAFTREVVWNKPNFTGAVGVKNLRFGDIITDIVANDNDCTVTSTAPFTLIINGTRHAIKKGENTIKL